MLELAPNKGLLPVQALEFDVCLQQYAAELAPFFHLTPVGNARTAQNNFARVWNSDFLVFAEGTSSPFSRSRTKKEVQDAGHLIEVSRYLSGSERGLMGETVLDRVPGPIYIIDQGAEMWGLSTQFHVQQMYVPKAHLDIADSVLVHGKTVDVTQSTGRLLEECRKEIFDLAKRDPDNIPMALINRFIALLKINLGVHPQREDVRTHLRNVIFDRICNFIEGNLGDPDLSSGLILQNFGVSRASLYRMFEDYGGVRCYITHRRITRAVMDIEQAPFERGRMRKAALDWGFSSQPNFNRSIRKAFQTSPSGLFGTERRGETRFSESGRILSQLAERSAALPIAA